MAVSAPKLRKHLSADALLSRLRSGFADLADHRSGTPDISRADALMSAFALFSLTSSSLLGFDKERTEGNVQRVYGIARGPVIQRGARYSTPSSPSPSARSSSTGFALSSAARRWKR